MWSGSECGRVLSETGNTATSEQSSDGKAGNHSVEDSGSDHPKGSGGEGDARRGSEADGVPWAYVATMEYQVQEDCVEAAVEARQLVAGNRAAGSG